MDEKSGITQTDIKKLERSLVRVDDLMVTGFGAGILGFVIGVLLTNNVSIRHVNVAEYNQTFAEFGNLGRIDSIEGTTVMVSNRHGTALRVKYDDDLTAVVPVKNQIWEIKQGEWQFELVRHRPDIQLSDWNKSWLDAGSSWAPSYLRGDYGRVPRRLEISE